jgi:hypothetical protein
MNITKIGLHHSGPTSPTDPYSSSAKLTEAQINAAHKAREFNLSKMGFNIGYNVIWWPDGSRTQYRLIGEQTAAATGSNFDTFHGCAIGNFTLMRDGKPVDVMPKAQYDCMRRDIIALIENRPESVALKVLPGATFSFTPYNIFPHRILQPNHTSCNGNAYGDNWGRNIAFQYLKEKNQSNVVLFKILCTLADFFNGVKLGTIRLGERDFSDEGIIYNP